MTTFVVTSVSSLRCHASTCFRIGSKLRCIRSTPTEMQSMRENDFECFASTGVNASETMRQYPAIESTMSGAEHSDRAAGIESAEDAIAALHRRRKSCFLAVDS